MNMRRKPGGKKAEKIRIDGYELANKWELKRYLFLKKRQERGEICGLACQQKFVLMENKYAQSTVGKRGGIKKGKLIMYGVNYYADFVYITDGSRMVVEDVKGFAREDYKLKKKWMYEKYGILIREIDRKGLEKE